MAYLYSIFLYCPSECMSAHEHSCAPLRVRVRVCVSGLPALCASLMLYIVPVVRVVLQLGAESERVRAISELPRELSLPSLSLNPSVATLRTPAAPVAMGATGATTTTTPAPGRLSPVGASAAVRASGTSIDGVPQSGACPRAGVARILSHIVPAPAGAAVVVG